MSDLWLDSETFSPIPISHGIHKYAEEAEVMFITWAIDDDPVDLWDLTTGEPCPPDLEKAIRDPEMLVWFQNGGKFDWIVAQADPNTRWIAEAAPLSRRRDTMVQAYSHSLPGKLETMCAALGVRAEDQKIDGKKFIRLFCMLPPKNVKDRSRRTRETHPVEWEEFKVYAKQDITAMRAASRKMPMWNYKGKQLELEALDAKINARGFCVDVALAEAAIRASDIAKRQLAVRTGELTEGDVGAATQRDEMLRHILTTYGIDLPDMQKDTIERRALDESLPEELRELLRVRLESTTTSVAKYSTLMRGVSKDDRLRGCKQFRGAPRTGRVGHRMYQPGNMPRPTMKADEIAWAIELLKMDAAHLVYSNVMKVCSNAIRGTIIAGPGKKLVVSDLANIEGRFAAWLAGEEWKLKAFGAYDTIVEGEFDTKGKPKRAGVDLYLRSYASSFNVPVDSIDTDTIEGYNQRQIGKVCLAKGSLVMTDSGWKPIETITTVDQLWDGVEWVSHQGLLSQGEKPVISLASLSLTADHSVLCGTQWREASSLQAEPTYLSQALVEGAARLPSRAISSALWVGLRRCSFVAIAGALSTVLSRTTSVAVAAVDALIARNTQLLKNVGGGTPTPCPRQNTALGYFNVWPQHEFVASRQTTQDGRTMVAGAFVSVICGSEIGQLFSRTFVHCLGGMIRIWKWIAKILTGTTSLTTFSSSLNDRICSTGVRYRSFKPKSTVSEKRMPTFDLACAGPRKRFTVMTSSGPLIVHNCELMFGYGGGVGAWITGAATYGIDLTQMTEQVYDTLPDWARDEASDFLQYLYQEAHAKAAKAREKLNKKIEQGPDAPDFVPMPSQADWDVMCAEEEAQINATLESRKLKVRFVLSEKVFVTCDAIKRLWRRAHPMISSYWKELENTIEACILDPGVTRQCRRLKIRRDGEWLRVGLPSGRALCYPAPRWNYVETDPATGKKTRHDGFSYMGISQYSKKWCRIGSYGGKVFENVVQAAAADQLLEAELPIDEAGFEIVMDVHDEVISEVDEDRDDLNVELLSKLLCSDLGWNAGLPLAAAGYEAYRYKKD